MDNVDPKNLRQELWLFMRLARPHFLLGGILLYGLGAAVVSYRQLAINPTLYIGGQLLVTSLQLMVHFMNEFYDLETDLANRNRTAFSGGSGALGAGGLPARAALYAWIVCLTLAAIVASWLLIRGDVPLTAWILLLLIAFGALSYSAPPLRLVSSGIGEIVASIVVAGLVPAFAYAIQTGKIHSLILILALPLIALHFAMILALALPDYASDLKFEKRTLMVRVGWLLGMRMHDGALLLSILLLGIAAFSGLPPRAALGTLIALPLALAQIWQLWRIRQGYSPQWKMLTLGAVGLFVLTTYLLTAGFLLS